jgi:hypothetical protein
MSGRRKSKNQTRSFVYDSPDRKTSETYPECGTSTYAYDDNNNVTQKTDARGVVKDRRNCLPNFPRRLPVRVPLTPATTSDKYALNYTAEFGFKIDF